MTFNGKMIIQNWNKVKGVNVRSEFKENAINDLINSEGDIYLSYVDKVLKDSNETDINKLVNLDFDYYNFKKENEASQGAEMSTINLLGKELVKLMGSELATNIRQQVENELKDFVNNNVLTKVISIDNCQAKPIEGVVHEEFETILKFVAMNEPVMLVGPAGSGKNVICKQVAESLGLQFYFSNAITQEYQLTGFVDAMGNFQGTQFYEAFTKGGLFLLDEIDASIPETLIKLNAAIANGYFDFPKYGRVVAHKDFRVIAAANTYGTGASLEYVGRNQLDGASLNRFAVVEVNYDEQIEKACSGTEDILRFCQAFRKIADKNGSHVIISYREENRLNKMINYANMDITKAIKTCLLKGLEADSIRMIYNEMPDSVSYKKYLKNTLN